MGVIGGCDSPGALGECLESSSPWLLCGLLLRALCVSRPNCDPAGVPCVRSAPLADRLRADSCFVLVACVAVSSGECTNTWLEEVLEVQAPIMQLEQRG
jgi:hypothetical protein